VILWLDDAHDVVTHMTRDAALLEAIERGHEPVLRLFQFRPPGITLGANQSADRELDLVACARDGIRWASRPTGGRAIFHADEWTYALAAPIDDPEWGGTRAAAYERMSRLVTASLVRLGVPALLAPGEARSHPAEGEGPRATRGPATPCFASTARHEIVVGAGKLVGSAQRRTARGLLQQGSVLLGDGHLRIADYLRLGPETRERVRAALHRAAATAGAWLGPDTSLERWAGALEAELGADVRIVRVAPVALSLTPSKSAPYTQPLPQAQA
jgi:lipoyl(octanoyl) transferase